ncbi:hypothetical protein QSJ18_18540 [Gordonia sp. ABSL1-1]|uniref:hypothetical protein n=1 Tax=Gordonia sp. ABSL1-1 TaxID=3053923 RepID=UPI0025745176|nr:hypothetical protein [Gordonia sp. ABSL1-1]MDL9938750.1 hypothetical protein [Gordonia sp. ABSL1-1]
MSDDVTPSSGSPGAGGVIRLVDAATLAAIGAALSARGLPTGALVIVVDVTDAGTTVATVDGAGRVLEADPHALTDASTGFGRLDREIADHLVRIGRVEQPMTADWDRELLHLVEQGRDRLRDSEGTFIMGREHIRLFRLTRRDVTEASGQLLGRVETRAGAAAVRGGTAVSAVILAEGAQAWPGLRDALTRIVDLPIVELETDCLIDDAGPDIAQPPHDHADTAEAGFGQPVSGTDAPTDPTPVVGGQAGAESDRDEVSTSTADLPAVDFDEPGRVDVEQPVQAVESMAQTRDLIDSAFEGFVSAPISGDIDKLPAFEATVDAFDEVASAQQAPMPTVDVPAGPQPGSHQHLPTGFDDAPTAQLPVIAARPLAAAYSQAPNEIDAEMFGQIGGYGDESDSGAPHYVAGAAPGGTSPVPAWAVAGDVPNDGEDVPTANIDLGEGVDAVPDDADLPDNHGAEQSVSDGTRPTGRLGAVVFAIVGLLALVVAGVVVAMSAAQGVDGAVPDSSVQAAPTPAGPGYADPAVLSEARQPAARYTPPPPPPPPRQTPAGEDSDRPNDRPRQRAPRPRLTIPIPGLPPIVVP